MVMQNALIMTLGTVMLTAMWGTSMNGWVICYAWSLFIYGIGVGGEYPMTSTHAMEGGKGEAAGVHDRMHRGRTVCLAFLMQGWGQIFNQLVLILLLLAFSGPDPPYGAFAAQWVFRLQFAFVPLPRLRPLLPRPVPRGRHQPWSRGSTICSTSACRWWTTTWLRS
jgi:MFS family permease